jgi:UDP-N-acetylenolpyruvoylglucosamine reductase
LGVGRNARQDVGQQFAVWIHAEVRSLAHQYLR